MHVGLSMPALSSVPPLARALHLAFEAALGQITERRFSPGHALVACSRQHAAASSATFPAPLRAAELFSDRCPAAARLLGACQADSTC